MRVYRRTFPPKLPWPAQRGGATIRVRGLIFSIDWIAGRSKRPLFIENEEQYPVQRKKEMLSRPLSKPIDRTGTRSGPIGFGMMGETDGKTSFASLL
jgi:hypothetical protein